MKVVFLMYDGTASNTVATFSKPQGIEIDPVERVWWQTSLNGFYHSKEPNWRGKTPFGQHRLFNIRSLPCQVIGVYDYDDPAQKEAMDKDAVEALKS